MLSNNESQLNSSQYNGTNDPSSEYEQLTRNSKLNLNYQAESVIQFQVWTIL